MASESRTDKIYRRHRELTKPAKPVVPDESRADPIIPPTDSPSHTETLPRHWFCVGISPAGNIFKQETESVSDLLRTCEHAALAWIDFWTNDFEKDAPRAAAELGFSNRLASSLFGEYSVSYQDFDTEIGMRLPSIQVTRPEVKSNPLLLLLRKNIVFTIHPPSVDRRFSRLRRYSDSVIKKIPVNATPGNKLTLLLMRVIDENNDRNFEELRKIEEHGDELSQSLTNPKTPRDKLGVEIYQMKHALITYLNALWETVDVLHALRYGDAELITNDPKLLNRINILADDVNRQIALGEHMSEVLASGLEVLQSIYNNQLQVLNNRLALAVTYLTIIGTAVLVPNTLATIFSNSAFNMEPGDMGWYIALIVGSTVLATGLAYWWARKSGWLPKKTD